MLYIYIYITNEVLLRKYIIGLLEPAEEACMIHSWRLYALFKVCSSTSALTQLNCEKISFTGDLVLFIYVYSLSR